jgi:hypothetical protein
MLHIEINGIICKLLAKQLVSFDINSLIFDTEYLHGSRTSTFKLVVDANSSAIFGSPEQLASRTKQETFVENEARLFYKNNVLFVGKFRLREATKAYYSGNFIFGLADLASLSKVKIADILQGEEYVFETTDLQAEMQKTITTPDSPVVFPVCKMQNKFYNRYKNGAFLLPRTVDDAGYPVPFLKLQAIFNLIIKRLGYHLQNPNWHLVSNRNPEFAQKAAQVAKVILFNNKILAFGQTVTQGEPVDVLDNDGNYLYQQAGEITVTNVISENLFYADYVPDMTVADFLKSVKNLFCLHYEIDNKKKEFYALLPFKRHNPPCAGCFVETVGQTKNPPTPHKTKHFVPLLTLCKKLSQSPLKETRQIEHRKLLTSRSRLTRKSRGLTCWSIRLAMFHLFILSQTLRTTPSLIFIDKPFQKSIFILQ